MSSHLLPVVAIVTFLFISLTQAEVFCHPQDKRALLQIKSSFGNPQLLASWLNTTDCCKDWDFIGCKVSNHRVMTLALSDGQLSGQIPPAVGDLTHLEFLSFHNLSNIVGPVQPAIAKLKRLSYLSLDMLDLTGPIPPFLGKLKKLTYISLANNRLSGSIPSELGSLQQLGSLILSGNKLTGSIPSSIGNIFLLVIKLDLSHNQLTGEIPDSFNNLTLTTIDLSGNNLQGDASMLFGANKTIEDLYLNGNQLEFNFSKIVFNRRLFNLNIGHNKIFGSLPSQLTTLSLQTFNVGYNRLCGEIPVGGQLQSFATSSYIHNKCLCGSPLPACK